METELLQQYREMLLKELDRVHYNPHRIPRDRDATLFDYLQLEAALRSAIIDGAVAHFIAQQKWPDDLDDETMFYLAHRFFGGIKAIDFLLESDAEIVPGQTLRVNAIVDFDGTRGAFDLPHVPSPYNKPEFLRWLLISCWRPISPLWLKTFSEGWLRESPPTPVAEK